MTDRENWTPHDWIYSPAARRFARGPWGPRGRMARRARALVAADAAALKKVGR